MQKKEIQDYNKRITLDQKQAQKDKKDWAE